MNDPTPVRPPATLGDVALFFVLACAITWLLDLPLMLAWGRHLEPPPWAMPLVALGALGPTLAALAIASRRGVLRDVFGRWRMKPVWIVIGLLMPAAVHLPATVIEVLLGGHPAQWFYPPVRPEHVAAMVVFSCGEEFGWHGFAYPRLAARLGPLAGSLLLGAVWGLWHLGMKFTPETGAPDPLAFLLMVADLALYSIVFAWVFERGNRSMAVAIAVHAGGHLDNIYRAPDGELRLRVLRFLVVAVVAAFAARSLARKAKESAVAVAAVS